MQPSNRGTSAIIRPSRARSARRRSVIMEALEGRRLLTGTVTGTVFNDQNDNQVQDSNEAGIPNIEVYVDLQNTGQFDTGDPSAVTNAQGVYTIAGVQAGSYPVREFVPTTAIQTLPVDYTQQTTITDGQTATVNFGQYTLNPSGSLNSLPALNGSATSVVQPDGKVIIVGQDTGGGYPNDSLIARYFPDGTLDTSFGGGSLFKNIGGTQSTLSAVTLQPNGDIIAVGAYYDGSVLQGYIESFSDTGQQLNLKEYTVNDSPGFASGGECSSIVPFGQGQVLVGGHTNDGALFLEDVNVSDLSPLASFGSGGFVFLYAQNGDPVVGPASLAISPSDGSIWAATTTAATANAGSGDEVFALAHFDTSGNSLLSNGFTEQGIGSVNASTNSLTVQSNGDPVVVGFAETSPDDFALMRFNAADGSLDTSFGGDSADNFSPGTPGIELQEFGSDTTTNAQAQTVKIEADGSFFVTGLSSDNGVVSKITSTYPASGSLVAQPLALPSFRFEPIILAPRIGLFVELERPILLEHIVLFNPVIDGLQQQTNSLQAQPLTQQAVGRLSQPLPGVPSVGPSAAAPDDPGVTPAIWQPPLQTLSTTNTVSYPFEVQYTDSVYGIDTSTLGFNNLNVSGPSLTNAPAIFTGFSNLSSTSVVAHYSVSLPSDAVWSSVDNGAYTISLNPESVASTSGAAATASVGLGAFNVSEAVSFTATITGNVTNSGSPASGVNITLQNSAGTVVGTSTTDANGNYSFYNAPSGFDTVSESLPAGYIGGPVGTDIVKVGAGPVTGPTFANTLSTAGGAIVGSVFVSGTNAPLPNVTVSLGSGETSAVTNAQGTYTFPGLVAGTYNVAVTDPANDTSVVEGNASVVVGSTSVSGPTFLITGNTGSVTGAVLNATANTPLPGITVSLTNSGSGVLTATTDADGNYAFENLPAGSYIVAEETPSYATATTMGSATVTVGTTAATGPVFSDTLIGGVVIGTVFNDLNGDGYQEAGEPGIPNVMIYDDVHNDHAYVAGDPMTMSGSNGSYVLTGVPAGAALIRQVLVASNYKESIPALGGAAHVTVGTSPVTANFGQTTNIYVSGQVFFDVNGNSVLDTGETGATGVVVYADENNDGTLDPTDPTANPNAAGYFAFTDLPAGTYTFRISYPSSDQQSLPGSGAGITVTLANSSVSNTGVDTALLYGVAPAAGTIGGTVTSATGTSLPGVTVFLDTNGNGKLDPGEISTITDSNGNYLFTNLSAGTYSVDDVVPASTANSYNGSTSAVVTSTLGAVGPAFTVVPAPGGIEGNVINGLTGLPEAGVVVYLDTNSNGMLDSTETSVTTDSTGAYQFNSLLPGTYSVAVVNPAGESISGTAAVAVTNSMAAGPTLLENPTAAGSGPDLALSIVSSTPSAVIGGTAGTVTLLIDNDGTANAVGRKVVYTLFLSSTPSLTAGDYVAYSVSRPLSLRAGRSEKLRLAFKYPSTLVNGTYYLLASINGTAYFSETNYLNNVTPASSAIAIAEPKITLSGTVVNPPVTSIAANHFGTLSIDVTNTGNVLAHGVITVGLYADPDAALDPSKIVLGTVKEAVVLQPGKSHVYRFRVKAPLSIAAGAYYLIADLNQTGSINDSDPAAEVVISPNTTQLG